MKMFLAGLLLLSSTAYALDPDDLGKVFCQQVSGAWLNSQCHRREKVLLFEWGYDIRKCLGDALLSREIYSKNVGCMITNRDPHEQEFALRHKQLFSKYNVGLSLSFIAEKKLYQPFDPGIFINENP